MGKRGKTFKFLTNFFHRLLTEHVGLKLAFVDKSTELTGPTTITTKFYYY